MKFSKRYKAMVGLLIVLFFTYSFCMLIMPILNWHFTGWAARLMNTWRDWQTMNAGILAGIGGLSVAVVGYLLPSRFEIIRNNREMSVIVRRVLQDFNDIRIDVLAICDAAEESNFEAVKTLPIRSEHRLSELSEQRPGEPVLLALDDLAQIVAELRQVRTQLVFNASHTYRSPEFDKKFSELSARLRKLSGDLAMKQNEVWGQYVQPHLKYHAPPQF